MNNNRLDYIDQTKGVGMMLIVIGHCFVWWPQAKYIAHLVPIFHVPIFFFAVGALYAALGRNVSLTQLLKKRLWQLMLPYVIFSLFNSAFKFAGMMALGTFSMQAVYDELPELLITGNGTVWFLSCLFFSELLFCATKGRKELPLLAALAVLVPLFYVSTEPTAVFLRRIPVAYFFIACGYMIMPRLRELKARCIVGIACVVASYAIEAFRTSEFSFFGSEFNCIWIEMPQCLLGCVGVVMFLQGLNRHIGWLEYIGKKSLGIMLVHPPVMLVLAYGIIPRLPEFTQSMQFVGAVLTTLIVLLGSVVVTELIDKYCPVIFGKRKA